MNTFRLVSICLISFVLSVGASDSKEVSIPKDSLKTASEEVFLVVEEMPKFQGAGLDGFRKYIAQSIKYPFEALRDKIEGRVYIQFVVNREGQVQNANVVKGIHELLNKEALRVVSSSPSWTPGYQQGKPVLVQFTIPITFSMDEDQEEKKKKRK